MFAIRLSRILWADVEGGGGWKVYVRNDKKKCVGQNKNIEILNKLKSKGVLA